MKPIVISPTAPKTAPAGEPDRPSSGAMQRHYTVAEIAKAWNLSQSTILRMFKLEPGVLLIGNLRTRKRTKISLRIPEDVAERVWKRLTNR